MLDSYPKRRELEEQVQRVKSETKKEQIENIEEINYANKTVPLKTERLREVFKRVETQSHEI